MDDNGGGEDRPSNSANGDEGARPTSASQAVDSTTDAGKPLSAQNSSGPAASSSRPASASGRPLSATSAAAALAASNSKPESPRTSKAASAQASKAGSPTTSKPASKTGTPQTSKPATPTTSKPGTPTASKPGTPVTSKPGTPQTSKPGTPQASKPSTPTASKPSTPVPSKPPTPVTSAPATPQTSRPPSSLGQRRVTAEVKQLSPAECVEDNLKRLVSEATRLCREAGVKVEPQVIAYLAALQDASHAWSDVFPDMSLEEPLPPRAVAAIGQRLFIQISAKSDATVATARLQVMMEVAFKEQRDKLDVEMAEKQEQAGMQARAVTGPHPIKDTTMPSYEKFYKRVFEYVCTQAGLERALTEPEAGDEVRAAMESVFPLSALARFLTMSEEEKTQQVDELSRITLGICLFNRAAGRGGHALPAGSAAYLPQASRLLRDLGRHILDAQRDVTALSAALSRHHGDKQDAARQELIFCAQALVLFESLQSDLEAGLDATQQLEDELQHIIVEAQQAVGGSTAVSKDNIFPLFDRLGAVHLALVEELRMLVVRQRLVDTLLELKQAGPSHVLRGLPKTTGSSASANGSSNGAGSENPEAMAEGLEYVAPSLTPRQFLPGVALSGFCPLALSLPDVLLQRANPAVGYLRYDDQLLGFASHEAMREFSEDPAGTMQIALGHVAHYPVLSRLVGRSADFPRLDLHHIVAIMSGPLKVDFGCQTPTHFLEKHIDVNYEWNEWALRRRALALANLRQKRTHSTQTAKTHFKRDGESQVWKPKETEVQTRVNKGQAMPKKLQYVAGLRGAPNVKMNVVRLDLDLGQPHQH